jgi:hypothetical protein
VGSKSRVLRVILPFAKRPDRQLRPPDGRRSGRLQKGSPKHAATGAVRADGIAVHAQLRMRTTNIAD